MENVYYKFVDKLLYIKNVHLNLGIYIFKHSYKQKCEKSYELQIFWTQTYVYSLSHLFM